MAEEKKNPTNEEIEENEDVEDQNENEDESGKTDNKADDKNDKSSSKSGSEKIFTQEQVTKMMAKEKNQGRNAAYKEMGINPKDTKMVSMFKAFVESQKTDEQKAAEKETENETKITEAEQRAMVAEAKAEAMMLGVKTQYVDDVVTLALAKMTEDSDLKTIIGEFKTKYSVWFGESEEGNGEEDKKGKTGQKGTGSSVKTAEKAKKGEEAKGLGARLAAQRKTSSNKSSYWGKK